MFQKYLQKILKEHLGEFIQEIDSKQLNVGVFSGKIDIKNIKLKKSLLQKYHLPITVKHSSIKGLSIKIPWKNLFGSPLVITIQSVLVLCQFSQENIKGEQRIQAMLDMINTTIKQVGQELVQKGKEKAELNEKAGLIDRIAYKMLDNLYLSIKNIHIRFQEKDVDSGLKYGYSFGCSLESIDVFAVGANNQKVFIDRSKFNASQTLIRKKIQMKNLSIYCNYGEQDFITQLTPIKQQKMMEQKLLKGIYTRQKFNSEQNKNNYILIMNVLGVMDENHKQALVIYDLKLNFQKLIVKLDKQVLNSLLTFVYKLKKLNAKHRTQIFRKQLTKEDDLLFRKYCNAYLSDFKAKDIWSTKDKQMISAILLNLHEQIIIQKIKYIVINQMSVAQLSKFFAVKGQDLDKGLLEVSKDIKDLEQPKLKIQIFVPQITLYLVNEFSESILELNILNISLSYFQKIVDENKVKYIEFIIANISAVNNSLYILSADQQFKNQKFFISNIQITPEITNVIGKVTSFNFYYDFETIFKIIELFHLREIDNQCRNNAADKMDELQAKVQTQVAQLSKMNLQIVICRPKVMIRQGKINWTISINQIQCLYAQQISFNFQSLKIMIYRQKEEYLFIEPFDIVSKIKMEQKKSKIQLKMTSITINFQYFIYSSMNNLKKYLFINKKNEIINKCDKSCEVFLKQNRWKKCFINLLDNHLYAWQNDSQYPLFNIRIRVVQKVKRGKIDILQISNKKKVFQIAFKDEKVLQEWFKELQNITERAAQDKTQEVKQILEDSETFLNLQLEKLSIRLNHHKFIKEQNEFAKEIQAITYFQFQNMKVSLYSSIQDNIKKSSILLNMEDFKFIQNQDNYVKKENKNDQIISVKIISGPTLKENSDQIIEVQVKALYFYLNTSAILLLLGFFHEMEHNNMVVSINYEQTLHQQNPNKILNKINVRITDITIIMQNKMTKMPFIKVCGGQINLTLLLKYYETTLNGNLRKIQVYDLTNYPQTVYYKENLKQIIPRIILKNNDYNNQISLMIKFFSQGSPDIKNGIKSLADVTINHISIYYIHQVIMRIIDYINNQLLSLVFYPDFYPEFYCQKQKQKSITRKNFIKSQKELLRMKFSTKIGKQRLKLMIETQKPLAFNIVLNNSSLNIISDYYSKDYLTFNITKAIISNKSLFHDHDTSMGKISIPHDHYLIQFKDVSIVLHEKGKQHSVAYKIGETKIDFKIQIQYFGGELDYKYILGNQIQINNMIGVNFQISMAKLKLNQIFLHNVLKIINRNFFQQDGINFLMVYELFQGSESLLNIVIHSELLIIQLKLQQQTDSILTQICGLFYKYDRNPQKVVKSITCKYAIFNFVNQVKDKFKEILTSRKIFGRVSKRGTYYTQLFKQNLLINIPQETSFQYQSIRNRKQQKIQSVLSAKEMIAILDINFILYLKKLNIQQEQAQALVPVYRVSEDEAKAESDQQTTLIKLDKIILCAQVPMSEIIISILATVYISIDINRTQIVIPELEAFISSSENITCNELTQMKKRTLLKQTHLKVSKNTEMTEINIGKCFFKISVNDFKSMHLIYNEINQQYKRFLHSRKADFREDIEVIEYIPQQKQINNIKMSHQKKYAIQSPPKKDLNAVNGKKTLKLDKQIPIQTSLQLLSLQKQKQHSPSSPLSPQSSIQSMAKQTIFNLDTIQLMLVDDLNDFLTPLIYVNIKLDLNHQNRAVIQFYADYFNLRNTLWEPLIQKNTILIDYDHNLVVKSLDPKQFININIASNFIENILKTINHKELKSSRLLYNSHKIDKDEINSWIIINQLGQDVICQSIDEGSKEKGVFVGKGEAQTLNFLSKQILREFKQKQSEDNFIKLLIEQKMIIKKLKINQLGLKRLNIATGDSSSIIIKNLYIDLSKNIKYLTLSSQIIFENKSDITIKLKQSKYNQFIYLLPFKSIPLPYYCNLNTVFYTSQNQEEHYKNLSNLQHQSKIQINRRLFNVSFNNRKLKKYFTFIPMYKLTNYLPFGMVINFKIKNTQTLYCSMSLSSYQHQSNNYGFLYKPLQELQASIWIEDYQYTDFFTIKRTIQIRDYSNNILTLKSQIYKDAPSPMIHIALMVNYIIRNQTKEVFDVFVDNHWIRDIKKGQYFISENNQINLILNGQKSDTVLLTKKNSCVSLRNRGNQMLKSQSDYCLYKNRIQFDNSTENRINFYISQLLPMYVLKNGNNYSIIFKQNGSGVGETQLIQAKTQENIKWYLDSSNKRKNPLFKFTVSNSKYEWSCLLNVQSIKKSYLVLRDKFDYMNIKYFLVNVKKIKESYQINCIQLANNDIPYIIRNNTKNYNIFIENLKVILKTGEESYFCWEDPSINQKKIKIKLYKSNISLQRQGMKSRHKQQFVSYQIKVDSFEQDSIKSSDQNLQIEVINQLNRQIFVFSDDKKDRIQTIMISSINLELPIRIALINNSSSPVSHIFDLTTYLCLQYQTYSTNRTMANLKLNQIQLDNHTKPLTYFPVVLSTNLEMRIQKQKFLQVQILTNTIRINIQEDFITNLMAFLTYLQSLTLSPVQASHILEQQAKQETFFISKLILPKITVQLEIQTKKFSIETTINLQKPEITSYPWKIIPYPIKTIAFNILSHLSISPWAFISSFGKGLSLLITQQQTSKGFEGFFQQLIGGFSNSINGMVGMIVGHDIEKVDNFVDGLNKGFWAFGASLYQILPNFQGDYSPINIVKQVGTSAVNLVFKPVTGILRMTLRVSQGIKKTTKFQFDMTSKKYKKRFPIIFYNRQQTFYTYDQSKSEMINTIKRALINQLKYFYLIDFIQIQYKLRNQRSCLIIGAEQLLLFNKKTEKMIWKLQIQKIIDIEIHNLCTIKFIVNSDTDISQQDHRKKYDVDINSQESVKKVMEIIQKVKKMSSIQL